MPFNSLRPLCDSLRLCGEYRVPDTQVKPALILHLASNPSALCSSSLQARDVDTSTAIPYNL